MSLKAVLASSALSLLLSLRVLVWGILRDIAKFLLNIGHFITSADVVTTMKAVLASSASADVVRVDSKADQHDQKKLHLLGTCSDVQLN